MPQFFRGIMTIRVTEDMLEHGLVSVALYQWVDAKSSNECFGRFYAITNEGFPSCGLEIELISDL